MVRRRPRGLATPKSFGSDLGGGGRCGGTADAVLDRLDIGVGDESSRDESEGAIEVEDG